MRAPATGPMRVTARGSHEAPIAVPTRMPASSPVRSAHTPVTSRSQL